MSIINVKPAQPGMKVLDPVRGDFIEAAGRAVQYTGYWARRLRDGDVVYTDGSGGSGGIVIGGGLTEVWNAIAQLQDQLTGVNHKPVVPASSATLFDVSPSTTVNLLAGAVDLDGDTMSVVGVSFAGSRKSPDTSFATTYGTVLVTSGGLCTYTPNSTAWALHAGQSITESIGYVVTDWQGANVSSSITFTVIGQNNAPVAIADIGRSPYNQTAVGNVLTNDYDPDKGALIVTQFVVYGQAGTFTAGSAASIPTVGSLVINANGSWTFTPVTGYAGTVPAVTYTVSNGSLTSTGVLNITVSPAAASVMADPVTAAMTGTHATYNIYSDADGNAVPWGALVAGDVVNIYWKSTPYRFKFGLRGQGTIGAPIVINGVTDSSGNRPQFDWSSGAFTAAGCNPSGHFGGYLGDSDVFSATQAYGESLGGILIKSGPNDNFDTYVPKWIQIKNLDLRGAHGTYTALDGTVQSWNGAGLWVLRSEDCLAENCLVTDNANGLFTQANNGTIEHTSVRFAIRNCRVWGNGVVGSFYEHNVYNQGWGSITEGCYLGQLRAGAIGSAFKSRQGAEVFRYNWVEANARAMDFVHSEDNASGIPLQPNYGVTWVYGNVIISDQGLTNGGSGNPIHFGGDNLGEQDSSTTVVVPSQPYRTQLYFWNNTFYMRLDTAAAYKAMIFQLSLVGTRCDAWNNVFALVGTTVFSWLGQAGVLNLRGTNLVYGSVNNALDTANAANYQVNKIGTLVSGDPLFTDMANREFFLQYSSAAVDAGGSAPSGLPMSDIDSTFPVEYQPRKRSNGYVARVQGGTAIDVGATEYGVGYTPPPPPAPANLVPPYATGSRVVGGTLLAHVGIWLGRPTFDVSFRDDADTLLGVGENFTSTSGMVHTNVHIKVVGTNSSGTATATSASLYILSGNAPVSNTPPSIVGTLVEGGSVTLNAGGWTNSPDSYTYELLVDGVVDSGSTQNTSATSTTVTLPVGSGGHSLVLRVSAHRTAYPLDTNDASTAPASVASPPADPDLAGTYNFTSSNGTTIGALNGGVWQGGAPSSTIRYECVDGALQCTAGTGSNGELCYLTAGQGNDQALEAKILAGWTGAATFYLQQTGTQSGYSFNFSATSWQARRGGVYQNGGGLSLSTSADVVVKLTLLAGVFTVYVNGTQVFQMTDSAPITGGGLAFSMGPGSDVTKMRMDYFKTNP